MGDLLAMRPIVAPPGEDLLRLVGVVELNTVAVELDFVNPPITGRHFLDRGCEGRLDEVGQGRLEADRLGFSTLKATEELHATTVQSDRLGIVPWTGHWGFLQIDAHNFATNV
jgi:hypothetical protein